MVFNSIYFYIFFSIVFLVYYFPLKGNTKSQNWLLLISSYLFYGYANWKMIPVLLVATVVIFMLGKALHSSKNLKKSTLLTTIGILTGVGMLMYFKYFNFFIDSFSSLHKVIGLRSNAGMFNIVMPLGISFFTFKLISYIIEIHRGKIECSRDFIIFSTYISFFPTILSGPIDKPNIFIPQLQKKREFNYILVVDGCRQILWGLFQKVVIADNLASIINNVWGDISNQAGSTLVIVAIFYSIQLYTDFSGYSHMAIGLGKVLGFNITRNFNYPYFSRTIGEFWRNWHISLTSWLTDYIFMPLNIKYRNLGMLGLILAIVINMLAVGMWHGPNWTFIVFGLYHGILYIPSILTGSFFKKKKLKTNKFGLPSFIDLFKMSGTFLLVTIGFIIFRADNITQVWQYLNGILDPSIITMSFKGSGVELGRALVPLTYFLILLVFEWNNRESEHPLARLNLRWKGSLRFVIYFSIAITIIWFGAKEQQFIYFQF